MMYIETQDTSPKRHTSTFHYSKDNIFEVGVIYILKIICIKLGKRE